MCWTSAGSRVVRGATTPAGADQLFFVGVSVQLSGQVREIGKEARAVAGAVDVQPVR